MTTYLSVAPHTIVQIDIAQDEDWADDLPQILNEAGTPEDLTGKDLLLFIRPTYDHSILIRKLSNSAGGIVYPIASSGRARFQLSRAIVQTIPLGRWDQFLVLDRKTGFPQFRELWRGPIIVHPGRTA